jgi:hypothetical protein
VDGVENGAERTATGTPSGTGVDGTIEADRLDPATLLPRLDAIEDEPLERRAAALTELHDELRARLEGGDAAAARG